MDEAASDRRVVSLEGESLGTARQRLRTVRGEVVLVQRAERLGGGTVVLPASELKDHGGEIVAPYEDLSIREAPPYSPDVPLESYLRFWERLETRDTNQSETEFLPTGSGPVAGPVAGRPDDEVAESVRHRLQEAGPSGVHHHLIDVTVRNGTVLLEGYEDDTLARLAAAQAAAAAPGAREVVNMIVVRAL